MADFPLYHRIADDENLYSISVLYYGTPEAWVYIKRANQPPASGGGGVGDDWENLPKDNLLLIPKLQERTVRRRLPQAGSALLEEGIMPQSGGHALYQMVKEHYGHPAKGGAKGGGGAGMYLTVRAQNPGNLTPGREIILPAQINPANLRSAEMWRERR